MRENDNWESEDVPFKGPFKGKGANRKIVKQLELRMDEIKRSMDDVVTDFNDAFPTTPRVANLRILNRPTYPLLWWRLPVNGGNFFQLFNSREGSKILARLERTSPNTINNLAKYDLLRIKINTRSKITGSMLESYKAYMEGMDIIDPILNKDVKINSTGFYG